MPATDGRNGTIPWLVLGLEFLLTAHLAPVVSGDQLSKGSTPAGIDVRARLVATEYYALAASDDVMTLMVRARLTVTNTTTNKTLVIARNPTTGPPSVAQDETRGRAGILEFAWTSWSRYATTPRRRLGDRPDPATFAVLQPGESFETSIEATLPACRTDCPLKEGVIEEGSSHAIDVPIEWSAPFFDRSNAEIAKVAERWRTTGTLVVGTSSTGWLQLMAPPIQEPKVCP